MSKASITATFGGPESTLFSTCLMLEKATKAFLKSQGVIIPQWGKKGSNGGNSALLLLLLSGYSAKIIATTRHKILEKGRKCSKVMEQKLLYSATTAKTIPHNRLDMLILAGLWRGGGTKTFYSGPRLVTVQYSHIFIWKLLWENPAIWRIFYRAYLKYLTDNPA